MSTLKIKPMLCRVGSVTDLSKKNYFFEPKLDGTRAILYKNRFLKIINRRNNNIAYRYPEILENLVLTAKSCILDGEIVVYKNGFPDFNLLQSREQLDNKFLIEMRSKQFPATYVIFDILMKDGIYLTQLPLSKRKEILKKTVKPNKFVELCYFTENGKVLWKEIISKKIEGVVAKEKNSKYYSGERSSAWLKIKNLKTLDCIIVGYTSEKRKISALVLAVYSGKKMIYIGKVAAGLSDNLINFLYSKFKKGKIPVSNFSSALEKQIVWVKPEFVCEVEYLELTKKKELRAPVLRRIRFDKAPKECNLTNF